MQTLPDHRCDAGGVLLIGINPSPVSVAVGHYYQGTHGKRLWKRLASLGLLSNASKGHEDQAFVAAGNGLTDLVKRPTSKASELRTEELVAGTSILRDKIAGWKPGLILFAYQPPAQHLLKGSEVKPGRCADLGGVPCFLLTNPYAKNEEAIRINEQLRSLLRSLGPGKANRSPVPTEAPSAHSASQKISVVTTQQTTEARTQQITASDRRNGRIRLPHIAKSFFPRERANVQVRLQGRVLDVAYDPRTGPDRERSAVLSVGKDALRSVADGTTLLVTRNTSGVILLV